MKNLKLIYSDKSGNRSFKNEIDSVLEVFANADYNINILRANTLEDITNNLAKTKQDEYDIIAIAGGDGSLNAVVNAVLKNELNTKIGIIPAGTANDFARFLKIDKTFAGSAKTIVNGKTTMVDVGNINDTYFINVFGAGTITNISNHINTNLKNTIGNMAYYLKAIEKFQSYTPIPVTITNSNGTFEENIYLFLALNTGFAGGIDNITIDSEIDDGYFDILAIKEGSVSDIVSIVISFLRKEHLNNEKIIYYKDNYTKLEFKEEVETNIDGEKGPLPPVEMNIIPKALEIFIP
ncbi:MAG: YegS/Rv2252/BmrU family lipid kinase [Defluviitaleaceae bacterium]|nr:YegS/Rv2252/BmrU family lipid kinase [Defluviitaleaceae bacterium]